MSAIFRVGAFYSNPIATPSSIKHPRGVCDTCTMEVLSDYFFLHFSAVPSSRIIVPHAHAHASFSQWAVLLCVSSLTTLKSTNDSIILTVYFLDKKVKYNVSELALRNLIKSLFGLI